MEEKKISCTLITPLFSYGAYNGQPELRASELKGAMRYAYRIACPTTDLAKLKKDEMELFGGAAGYGGPDSGHMSPVRLAMSESLTKEEKDFLLHKANDNTTNKLTSKKQNNKQVCFCDGSFEIIMRLNWAIGEGASLLGADLSWYENLIKFSLIVCGMGRRGRKGRGCFAFGDQPYQTKEEAMEWLCSVMNGIAAVSPECHENAYDIQQGEIEYQPNNIKEFCRPVIQRIKMGEKLGPDQIERFLRAVDQSCHIVKKYGNIKDPKGGNQSSQGAKGKARSSCSVKDGGKPKENVKPCGKDANNEEEKRMATGGSGKQKFASPLLVRLMRIGEDYFPLYIFVKGVYYFNEKNTKMVDLDCGDRNEFIRIVEEEMNKTDHSKRA